MENRTPFALAAVVGLLGFLLVVAASAADATRQVEAPRKARLIELIEERRSQVDELDAAVSRLRSEVAQAEDKAAEANELDQSLADRLAQLSLQAGTVPVEGPGLVVRMSDSERSPSSTEDAEAFRIHDSDIQLAVNALFAAGAEAVAVNDSRIVATSPIRAAGDTIVVNFRPLVPPYRIVGIGADRAEFAASGIAQRFKRWTDLFGLGFSVKSEQSLRVPAFTGRVGISSAAPGGVD